MKKILAVALVFMSQYILAAENYQASDKGLIISNEFGVRECSIDGHPDFFVKSYDGSALIVSETGYIVVSDLAFCDSAHTIKIKHIPQKMGVLSDINVGKNVFVTLDFVSVAPFSYLAIVSRIGSTRNLVNLDGAYIVGKPISKLRKSAFTSSGDAGSSTISPDGRFVAPSGDVDCDSNAYPGVWDIINNKRVFTDKDACAKLFDKIDR